jgi:hypothetical protein
VKEICRKIGLECLLATKEHDRCGHWAEASKRREFDVFEVEVPVKFFGTQGFSARREGRYFSRVFSKNLTSCLTLAFQLLLLQAVAAVVWGWWVGEKKRLVLDLRAREAEEAGERDVKDFHLASDPSLSRRAQLRGSCPQLTTIFAILAGAAHFTPPSSAHEAE